MVAWSLGNIPCSALVSVSLPPTIAFLSSISPKQSIHGRPSFRDREIFTQILGGLLFAGTYLPPGSPELDVRESPRFIHTDTKPDGIHRGSRRASN